MSGAVRKDSQSSYLMSQSPPNRESLGVEELSGFAAGPLSKSSTSSFGSFGSLPDMHDGERSDFGVDLDFASASKQTFRTKRSRDFGRHFKG